MMITAGIKFYQLKYLLKPLTCVLVILLTGCKMWPLSVGIYNRSEEKIEVELYVENKPGASEYFPVIINKFGNDYTDTAFRNLSPIKTDTAKLGLKTLYQLYPGECITIASYWDDDYKGYAYYQSADGSNKKHLENDFRQIIIRQGGSNIAGTPLQLERLVKPLNPGKKVWGILVK